jgi:hypothetical protein
VTMTGQNVDCYAGETVTIHATVIDLGVAGLADYTITYVLNTPTPLTKVIGSGVVVTDEAGAEFVIVLTAAETSALSGVFTHGCKIEDDDGAVSEVFNGTVTVRPSVVRAI